MTNQTIADALGVVRQSGGITLLHTYHTAAFNLEYQPTQPFREDFKAAEKRLVGYIEAAQTLASAYQENRAYRIERDGVGYENVVLAAVGDGDTEEWFVRRDIYDAKEAAYQEKVKECEVMKGYYVTMSEDFAKTILELGGLKADNATKDAEIARLKEALQAVAPCLGYEGGEIEGDRIIKTALEG